MLSWFLTWNITCRTNRGLSSNSMPVFTSTFPQIKFLVIRRRAVSEAYSKILIFLDVSILELQVLAITSPITLQKDLHSGLFVAAKLIQRAPREHSLKERGHRVQSTVIREKREDKGTIKRNEIRRVPQCFHAGQVFFMYGERRMLHNPSTIPLFSSPHHSYYRSIIPPFMKI